MLMFLFRTRRSRQYISNRELSSGSGGVAIIFACECLFRGHGIAFHIGKYAARANVSQVLYPIDWQGVKFSDLSQNYEVIGEIASHIRAEEDELSIVDNRRDAD